MVKLSVSKREYHYWVRNLWLDNIRIAEIKNLDNGRCDICQNEINT